MKAKSTSAPKNSRKAIVTGGAKGYGYGIAAALVAAGYKVWITGRDAKALAVATKKLGVHALQADVTSAADWDRVFATVDQAPGRFSVLINNAGGGIRIAPASELSDAEVAHCLAVNLTGPIMGACRAAPRIARAGGGTIVNIGSVCAYHAWPDWSVYAAAKAGIVQFSKGLYLEHKAAGVRVTVVTPSWGATEFRNAANLDSQTATVRKQCIQPAELGEQVARICALSPHLFVQDLVLWPTIQDVSPL